jgi:hypothetical protein
MLKVESLKTELLNVSPPVPCGHSVLKFLIYRRLHAPVSWGLSISINNISEYINI